MMHKHRLAKRVERPNAAQRRQGRKGAIRMEQGTSVPRNEVGGALTHGNIGAIWRSLLPAVRRKNIWWCAQYVRYRDLSLISLFWGEEQGISADISEISRLRQEIAAESQRFRSQIPYSKEQGILGG